MSKTKKKIDKITNSNRKPIKENTPALKIAVCALIYDENYKSGARFLVRFNL